MTNQHVLCAKEIRTILKKNFESVKFNVRSKKHANCSEILIKWHSMNPSKQQVSNLIQKYQRYKGKDVLDNTSWDYIDDIPQVDYIGLENGFSN